MKKINAEQWDTYAEQYHDYIISPFQKGIDNPLFDEIKKISARKDFLAADLGTGRGEILPFLSYNFKKVYAIDFSKKMLEIAKQNNTELKNIIFKRADMRELTKLGKKFDVIITINSVLLPSAIDVSTSFDEIGKSTKKGGYLIGNFPSLEATLYLFTLVYERELAKYNDEKKALMMTKRIMERRKYDFIRGIFDDNGEKQKLYYQFEIEQRLADAGFEDIKISKMIYPWDKVGDFSRFDDKDNLWDWFVVARKK